MLQTEAGACAREKADQAPGVPATPVYVHGWGGGRRARVLALRPATVQAAVQAVAAAGQLPAARAGVIARGQGRAYNDAAQRSGGVVLDTAALQAFDLDERSGTVTAQAGATLGALLRALLPRGWMVPVVPGTQHVSLGGAIASDIHGKNHGLAGAFGAHVQALGLLTAGGEVLELAAGDPAFAAALGGMGLTGIVLWARIKLRAVSSPWLSVDSDRVADLDGALAALRAPGGAHRVAWLDLLGRRPGRGIVTRAEHLEAGEGPDDAGREAVAAPRARATVPRSWPAGALRPSTVRVFNALRFGLAPARRRGAIESIGGHMFPLDGLDAWPRLYGARGLAQYQFVVPFGVESVLHTVVERLRRSTVPCYLAVLKDFGPAGAGPLSFPMPGWTLALDMPRAAPGLGALLAGFDELVAEAGGRVYLAKDPRVEAAAVRAMYPRLAEWQAIRERLDPERLWCSDLALRAGLVEP